VSGSSARGFAPVLREVERGLALPIPERVRILRELEYVLEELCAQLVAGGLSDELARRRALQALVPDGATLRELDRLHAPWYRRVTRHLAADRLRLAERSTLAIATALVVIGQTVALLSVDLLRDPSLFLWPVLGLGTLLFVTIVAKVFNLWIKRDHRTPARGMGTILGLVGATLLTGIFGVVFDLYRLAVALETTPELFDALIPVWLRQDMALLSVSLLLALGGGLAWFVLNQWLRLVDGARNAVLGLNDLYPPNGETRDDDATLD
jgi:hypothetical protein